MNSLDRIYKGTIISDKIIKYALGVFTNDGQSTVGGGAGKLEKVADDIKQAGAITVYYGFHGDGNGDLYEVFSDKELEQSLIILKAFPDVKMVKVLAPDDKISTIRSIILKGRLCLHGVIVKNTSETINAYLIL